MKVKELITRLKVMNQEMDVDVRIMDIDEEYRYINMDELKSDAYDNRIFLTVEDKFIIATADELEDYKNGKE